MTTTQHTIGAIDRYRRAVRRVKVLMRFDSPGLVTDVALDAQAAAKRRLVRAILAEHGATGPAPERRYWPACGVTHEGVSYLVVPDDDYEELGLAPGDPPPHSDGTECMALHLVRAAAVACLS